ncbi:MAG: AEC family transporter [Rhodobacteraceae bacterium]|nr:AEC family transporter [Paracoccaceae bacterium]
MMLSILQTVLPVFLIIGAGYCAVRFNLFAKAHADALMKFTQNFAIPCLLFLAIARLDLETVFRPQILLSFYTGSLTCFILGTIGARMIFHRRPGEAVAIGFCGLYANSVLLGLPIIERAYGTAAQEPVFAIIAIHAPFCYLLGITTMEFARADGRRLPATIRIVSKAMFSNALMIGLMLGFLANLTNTSLPETINSAVDMLARAALPAALFGMGGVLVRYGLTGNMGEVAMIVVVKLVIHPIIALMMATLVFGLSDTFTRAVVVTAAMAPGVNTYVFANMYNRAKDTAAASVLIGTALSIVSVSLWIGILGQSNPQSKQISLKVIYLTKLPIQIPHQRRFAWSVPYRLFDHRQRFKH